MSDRVKTWAIEQPVASPAARDVLLALAARATDAGAVTTTFGELCGHLHMSLTEVYGALRYLMQLRLLRFQQDGIQLKITLALSSGVDGQTDEQEAAE